MGGIGIYAVNPPRRDNADGRIFFVQHIADLNRRSRTLHVGGQGGGVERAPANFNCLAAVPHRKRGQPQLRIFRCLLREALEDAREPGRVERASRTQHVECHRARCQGFSRIGQRHHHVRRHFLLGDRLGTGVHLRLPFADLGLQFGGYGHTRGRLEVRPEYRRRHHGHHGQRRLTQETGTEPFAVWAQAYFVEIDVLAHGLPPSSPRRAAPIASRRAA